MSMKSTNEELFRLVLVWIMGYLTAIFVREVIISEFLREITYTYTTRVKPHVHKAQTYLRRFLPILTSFLYVTLLFLPWVTEIIVVSYQTNEDAIITIKNCSIVLSFLSIVGGLLMGYQYHCCCNKKDFSETEQSRITKYVFASTPMKLTYLYSPGYILYVILPCWLVNIITYGRMNEMHKVAFPVLVDILVWIPLLIYFPFFAVGSSYRNVLKDEEKCEIPIKEKCLPELPPSSHNPTNVKQNHVENEKSNEKPSEKSDDTKPVKVIGRQLYTLPPHCCDFVQGESSKVIYQFMNHGFHRSGKYHPTDVDDYERNRALLLCFPQWEARIDRMGELSKEWKILTEHWDEIEEKYCKDYESYNGKVFESGECNKYIHQLLKSVRNT